MTRQTTPVERHHIALAGLPQAADWIGQFAAIWPVTARPRNWRDRLAALGRLRFACLPRRRPYEPVHPVLDSPAWSALAVRMLDTHRRRIDLAGPALEEVDGDLAQLIRKIDATIAAVVDIPADDVGIGELLSAMAARWMTYAATPDADTSLAGVLKAQRDYNTRVEQLPLMRGNAR